MYQMTKITAGKPILSQSFSNKAISTLNPFLYLALWAAWLFALNGVVVLLIASPSASAHNPQKEKRLFACFCSHKITHLFIQFQKECYSIIFHLRELQG